MDTEIKDMLFKLLEGQTRLEGEISGIKSEVKEVKEEVNNLKGEVKDVKEEVNNLKGEVKDVKEEVGNLKGEIKEVKEEVSNLKGEIKEVKEEVSDLKEEVSNLKGEVKKNSIKLEDIEKKLDIITEVQTSHKEQKEREFDKSNLILEEKTNLIHTSVKNISKDVNEVKQSIEVLKDMTGRHEVDINILKRKPV